MQNDAPDFMRPFLELVDSLNLALEDDKTIAIRHDLASFTAEQFLLVADEIAEDISKLNEGSVEDAVSLLLRISSALVSGANDLFLVGNAYGAAALVRQLVEVEYLAYAVDDNQDEARKWIRSDKETRAKFFSPRKLGEASKGKFRSKDYGDHCELGGHPVPGSEKLLIDSKQLAQLLLSDMLGHTGRIWDHLVNWARSESVGIVLARNDQMVERYVAWKKKDPIANLPPFP